VGAARAAERVTVVSWEVRETLDVVDVASDESTKEKKEERQRRRRRRRWWKKWCRFRVMRVAWSAGWCVRDCV
jgi:hypothetical protein